MAAETGIEVFSGVAPTTKTDLDLSAYVGAALVWLRFENNSGDATAQQFRTFFNGGSSGFSYIDRTTTVTDGNIGWALARTDVNGILEWNATAAKSAKVQIIGWWA